MPVKRRVGKARNDFETWASTLGSGYDFFGDLPEEMRASTDTDNGRTGPPSIAAARAAWAKNGARMLDEKAVNPANFGNGSLWALWAFGPPPGAYPDALNINLAQMQDDWNVAPDWADREAAQLRLAQDRARLAAYARCTGRISKWVSEHFPDLRTFCPSASA